jgi:cytochrome c oxidase assembly protein subunit 15
MDEAALELINQRRIDVRDFRPITAFQIGLHMAHRMGALLTLAAISVLAWRARKELGATAGLTRLSWVWLGIGVSQAALGAATVWSNKAADIATAHVVLGALSLLCAGLVSVATCRLTILRHEPVPSSAEERENDSISKAKPVASPI